MLVNGNDFYCGNSSSNPLQLALKSMIPDVSGFATSSDFNSLKTSVSNGKSLIASAITGKGVSTDAGASFQTMANNIGAIPVGFSSSIPLPSSWTDYMLKYKADNDLTKYSKYAVTTFNEGDRYGTLIFVAVDRISRVGFAVSLSNNYNVWPYQVSGYIGPANLYGGVYGAMTFSNGGDSVKVSGAANIYLYGSS